MGIQINGQTDTISASDGSLSAIGLDLSSVTSINASGVSTFSNGPVLIGSGTSTGTISQPLQVTGGAYVSGNLGVGATNSSYKLDVSGVVRLGNGVAQGAPSSTNILTNAHTILSGEGANYLTIGQYGASNSYAQWIQSAFSNPSTATYNIVLQPLGGNVCIGASLATGTASQRLQVTGGAYVSGNVGIGSTIPTYPLDVVTTPVGTALYLQGGIYQKAGMNWNFAQQYYYRNTSNAPSTKIISFLLDGDSASSTNLYSNVNFVLRTDSAPTTGSASTTLNAGLEITSPDTIRLGTNGAERFRVDSTGNFSITQTPGKYTVDTSGGATSIANNGTVDFPNASGMLVVNNHTNGAVTIYLCGGGNTLAVSSVVAQVGTLTYVSGIAGYRWTNTYGSAATVGFFFVRTRTTA